MVHTIGNSQRFYLFSQKYTSNIRYGGVSFFIHGMCVEGAPDYQKQTEQTFEKMLENLNRGVYTMYRTRHFCKALFLEREEAL